MRKYPGVLLALTTAVMITSCSSLFQGADEKSTEENGTKEAVTAEAEPETAAIKIENETEPESETVPETSEAVEAEEAAPAKKPEETEAAKVYAVTAMKKTMYATQPVHVRASYTTKSEVLTSIGTGHKVAVTGMAANGWMRISYQGSEAYIYKKYLSESKPETGNGSGSAASGSAGTDSSSGNSANGNTSTGNSSNGNPSNGNPSNGNTPSGNTPNGSSTNGNSTAPAGPSVPAGEENIPIVEPSPLTATTAPQNTNSTAGPGSYTAPGAGSTGGIISPVGPGM